MERYYLVTLSNGKTSMSLQSMPDAASWLEDNWDESCRHASIKEFKVDKKKLIKDSMAEMQKLEKRLIDVKEKLARINGATGS